MDDQEIARLLKLPKQISDPPSKWKVEGSHRRKDFRLMSLDSEYRFRVFARQHVSFMENFSVGLEYEPLDGSEAVVLIRCNGPHGDYNRAADPAHPHFHYHVHRATADAIESGERPESRAERTEEFRSLKEAMRFFLAEVSVDSNDQDKYFADDLKRTLFDQMEEES